jgi:AraC-like DNA-binding protein
MVALYRSTVVAVAAASVNDASVPANVPTIELRADGGMRAGTFAWNGEHADTGWHRHACHQVEYAVEGIAEVETPDGRYLLPPHQAIWIPAGLPHVTRLHSVRSISAFLDTDVVDAPDERAHVLAAAPVIREMLLHALRWPVDRTTFDASADTFFDAFAAVVVDALTADVPLWLPTTVDPLVAAVLARTDADLAAATVASVCAAVGLSERTLRRRVVDAIGITWQEYVLRSRVVRASAMLADGGTIAVVAATVGFDSPSAFARAFRRLAGESPSAYRRRVTR